MMKEMTMKEQAKRFREIRNFLRHSAVAGGIIGCHGKGGRAPIETSPKKILEHVFDIVRPGVLDKLKPPSARRR